MDLGRKAIPLWQGSSLFPPSCVTEPDRRYVREGARPAKAGVILAGEFSCKLADFALDCGSLPAHSPASRDSLMALARRHTLPAGAVSKFAGSRRQQDPAALKRC